MSKWSLSVCLALCHRANFQISLATAVWTQDFQGVSQENNRSFWLLFICPVTHCLYLFSHWVPPLDKRIHLDSLLCEFLCYFDSYNQICHPSILMVRHRRYEEHYHLINYKAYKRGGILITCSQRQSKNCLHAQEANPMEKT